MSDASVGGRRAACFGALLLAALAVFVALRLDVTTDITFFLPTNAADPELELARQLVGSELSRTLLLVVDAPDEARALQAGRDFEAALRAEPAVAAQLASLRGGVPERLQEALWELYEPRRFGFLRSAPGDRARTTPDSSALTDAEIASAVRRLHERLASPLSSLVSRVAPADPLLLLPALFEDLAATRADGLRVVDGRFLSSDGRGAVLFLGTRAPAFDSRAQGPLLDGVRAAFARLPGAANGELTLQLSGAARFALRAEASIRADIQRVSIGSLVGLTALLLAVFGSLRVVLLTLPVLAAGFTTGLAACLLVDGTVHGLTLAFGAALLGVCVDYTVHVHCHHLLAPDAAGPRATLRALWPGLALGAATTVLGFVALLVSDFPGMRELALFSATGIAAALIATRLFLPALLPREPRVPARTQRLVDALDALAGGLGRHPRLRASLLLAVALAAALGLTRLEWNDSLADLNRLDPELLAEDAAVRARVAPFEQRRMLVATGADDEAALRVADALDAALSSARAAGELGGFAGPSGLLPSAQTQQRARATLSDDSTLWPRLSVELEAAGFQVDAFAPFREALAAPAPSPVTWELLRDTPLAELLGSFRVRLREGVGWLAFVRDVHDEPALRARLAVIPGAHLVDISGAFSNAYATYRARMLELLLLGLLAIVALVALRHRRARPTLAACLPAFLAAAASAGLLALAGVALNLLSLVALLMVVSMGVDYGVFLAEAGQDARARRATHLAILVSAVSSMIGFALLALSDHPSLFSIGAAASLGLAFCVLLAPLLAATPRSRATAPPSEDTHS